MSFRDHKKAFSSINRVQANRLRQGLSQAQLSEKAGVSRTAVATTLMRNPQTIVAKQSPRRLKWSFDK
ncbi:MAG: helix-turn-helix domain-containing protein [Pirellula sp.]